MSPGGVDIFKNISLSEIYFYLTLSYLCVTNVLRTSIHTRTHHCIEAKKMMRHNTLRPRRNGRHFPEEIFKCIFLGENVRIQIQITLKFVSKGVINNILAFVQTMAWRRPGDKSLSESMMFGLPTHICVTRPEWVNIRHFASLFHWPTCCTATSATLQTNISQTIFPNTFYGLNMSV